MCYVIQLVCTSYYTLTIYSDIYTDVYIHILIQLSHIEYYNYLAVGLISHNQKVWSGPSTEQIAVYTQSGWIQWLRLKVQ